MELASRDVISRAEQTEIDEGRGIDGNVLLDLRHLGAERILERLHGTRELSMVFAGIDPIYDPIPVRPGAHYHMGGVDTDVWAGTELDGLYAAGEVACISVHGANRLGGNALMETIIFGRRAGANAAEAARAADGAEVPESAVRDADAELRALLDRTDGERPWRIRDELAASMHENFGVFRREEQMEEQGRDRRGACASASKRVVVEDKGEVFNSDLTQALELGYLLELAETHGRRGPRAEGEPRRPRAAGRLSGPGRRGLPAPHAGAQHRRRARSGLEAGHDHELAACRAGLLMLPFPTMRLIPLALLALALPACGGSSSDSGNPVADAATSTAEAGTELTQTTGKVSYPDQTFSLAGNGGWNHKTGEGWQHLTLTVQSAKRVLDEAFIGNVLWLKSDLFSSVLPSGKQWLKVDTARAGKKLGFNFKGLMGETSNDVLKQLERTATPVKTIGKEEVDGVETTHYRARIDPKIPAHDPIQRLTSPAYKPVDVWVDGDDHVRQVKLDYTTKAYTNQAMRAHILLTMKLSDFGATVDVEPPTPSTVIDVTTPVP